MVMPSLSRRGVARILEPLTVKGRICGTADIADIADKSAECLWRHGVAIVSQCACKADEVLFGHGL